MLEKLIDVEIPINFCEITQQNTNDIKKEFDFFGEHNQDPINNWFKLAKAKGDISESENILLNLVVELHKKLDKIEKIIENKQDTFLNLNFNNKIISLGHEHIKLNISQEQNQDKNIEQKKFYGRLDMPVFPRRQIPIYFSYQEEQVYKIDFMHNRDIIDYDSYITAKERALIREMKGYSE